MIQALLVKPKTLLILMKIILVGGAIIWQGAGWIRLTLIWSLLCALMVDLFYYSYGLLLVSEPKKFLNALIRAPIYVVVWIYGWILSVQPGNRWLRGRD